MPKRKKKKSNTPRHKRMNRKSRLQAAPHWIPNYNGKNLVRGYSKHLGVGRFCAITELELLGYQISEAYKQQLKMQLIQKQRVVEERKANKESNENEIDNLDLPF